MQVPPQAAHTGAGAAALAWLISLATSAEPVISSLCALVGIVSGCFAIAWYWKGLRGKSGGSP